MARSIAVLALNRSLMTSIGLFLDCFHHVHREVDAVLGERETVGMSSRIQLLGMQAGPVRLRGGHAIVATQISATDLPRHIHLPDFDPTGEGADLVEDQAAIIRWLHVQRAGGASISATGEAVRLLAMANLLEEGPVALPRRLIPCFRASHPRVQVDPLAPFIDRGGIATAGSAAGEAYMMLHLIDRLISPWIASSVGAHLGIATEFGLPGTIDDVVTTAQIWIGRNSTADVRLSTLAADLGVSQSTLTRRFRDHLGMTPGAYLKKARIDSAKQQLVHTGRPIGQIANIVGYDDLKSFRAVFRAHTGLSPYQYRVANRSGGSPRTASP